MRSRRPAIDHSEAVARRLALLSAELDAARHQSAVEADGPEAVERAPLTRITGHAVPWVQEADPMDPAPSDAESLVARGLPDLDPGPLPLPMPGRHAARRRSDARDFSAWTRPLAAVRGWAPGQVTVVLAGIVLALGLTCAWLVTGLTSTDVEPVSAPAVRSSGTTQTDDPSPFVDQQSTPAAGQPKGDVVVDVAGKVKRPGLVVLPAGSRVADALAKAGGPRRGADTTTLNLARVLVDGEQLLVGLDVPAGAAGSGPPHQSPPSSGANPPGALVSINQADQALLETLPGVGPVTAQAILEWRTTHGGFTALDDLLEVRGIGEATMARLRPLITL